MNKDLLQGLCVLVGLILILNYVYNLTINKK